MRLLLLFCFGYSFGAFISFYYGNARNWMVGFHLKIIVAASPNGSIRNA